MLGLLVSEIFFYFNACASASLAFSEDFNEVDSRLVIYYFQFEFHFRRSAQRMFAGLWVQWKISKQLKQETALNLHFYGSQKTFNKPASKNLVDSLISATPSEAWMSIKTFISIVCAHIAVVGR